MTKDIRATSLADKYITKDGQPKLRVVTATEPLDMVEEYLRRFVVYPNEHASAVHALWIAHTHLMECWDTTPRLAFMSAQPGSGKTRALEVSELLVLSPKMSASMSAAALVRIIAKARKDEDRYLTILYDEIDGVFGKAEEGTADLRSALNAGYRRNGMFTRCINSGASVEDYPCYAALAVAGLNKLPDALANRSIFVHMKPRAADEAKEDFRLRDQPAQAEPIYDAIFEWCERKKTALTNYRPELPEHPRPSRRYLGTSHCHRGCCSRRLARSGSSCRHRADRCSQGRHRQAGQRYRVIDPYPRGLPER